MDSNEKDFLNFYLIQTWEENRHLENLREKVTFIIMTIALAIVGFVIQQKFVSETKPLMYFIIVLGFFGLLWTLKLFQIHQLNQKRLNKWYEYFEKHCGVDPKILVLRDLADKESRKEWFILSKIRHNYFWSIMHVTIMCLGFYLLVTPYAKENFKNSFKSGNQIQLADSTNAKIDTAITNKIEAPN